MKKLTEFINESLINEDLWTNIRKQNKKAFELMFNVLKDNKVDGFDQKLLDTLKSQLEKYLDGTYKELEGSIYDNPGDGYRRYHYTSYDYTMGLIHKCEADNTYIKGTEDDYTKIIEYMYDNGVFKKIRTYNPWNEE